MELFGGKKVGVCFRKMIIWSEMMGGWRRRRFLIRERDEI